LDLWQINVLNVVVHSVYYIINVSYVPLNIFLIRINVNLVIHLVKIVIIFIKIKIDYINYLLKVLDLHPINVPIVQDNLVYLIICAFSVPQIIIQFQIYATWLINNYIFYVI
jgi:hypothetical protein